MLKCFKILLLLSITWILLFSPDAKAQVPNTLWELMPYPSYEDGPEEFISTAVSNDLSLSVICSDDFYYIFDNVNNKLINSVDNDLMHTSKAYFTKDNNILFSETGGIYFYSIRENNKKLIIAPEDLYEEKKYPINLSIVAVNDKEDNFACVSHDSTIMIYDYRQNKIKSKINITLTEIDKTKEKFTDLKFSLDGKKIIAVSEYGFLFVIDAIDNKVILKKDLFPHIKLEYRDEYPHHFEVLSDSTIIYTEPYEQYDYMIIDFSKGEVLKKQKIESINASFDPLYISNNKKYLYNYFHTSLSIYEIATSKIWKIPFEVHNNSCQIISDDIVLLPLVNGPVIIYNFKEQKIENYISLNHTDNVYISPDNKYIYTMDDHGYCKIDLKSGKILNYYEHPFKNIFYNGEGFYAYTGSRNDSLHVYLYDVISESTVFHKAFDFDLSEGLHLFGKVSYDRNRFAVFIDYVRAEVYDLTSKSLIDSSSYGFALFNASSNIDYLVIWHQFDYRIRDVNNHFEVCQSQHSQHDKFYLIDYKFFNKEKLSAKYYKLTLITHDICDPDSDHDIFYTGPNEFIYDYSAKGKYLILCTYNKGEVRIYDLEKNIIKYKLYLHSAWLPKINLSKDESYIACDGGKNFFLADFKVTGIEPGELNNTNNVVYPNPANEILYFKPPEENPKGNMQIYSSSGIKLIESEYNESIDISGFHQGIYFIVFNNKVYKFVKL